MTMVLGFGVENYLDSVLDGPEPALAALISLGKNLSVPFIRTIVSRSGASQVLQINHDGTHTMLDAKDSNAILKAYEQHTFVSYSNEYAADRLYGMPTVGIPVETVDLAQLRADPALERLFADHCFRIDSVASMMLEPVQPGGKALLRMAQKHGLLVIFH